MSTEPSASSLPESAEHLGTSLIGLTSMFGGVFWMLLDPEVPPSTVVPVLMVLCAGPILALNLLVHRVHRRASTGLDWDRPRPIDWSRVATKWLGAAGAVGLVVGIYFFAPEYGAVNGEFYTGYFDFLWTFAPPVALLGVGYIAWLDRYLVEPRDGYYELGRMMLFRPFRPDAVGEVLKGWIIKGFFLPLMFCYALTNVDELRIRVLEGHEDWFVHLFDSLWSFGFLVDVMYSTVGYIISFRVFDTHLRSSEPTTLGWVVALICYQPFWGLVATRYLAYDNGYYWADWLREIPVLRWVWGAAILLTLGIYAGSTVAFGCRFSNLTHRGVLTSGFYRFTKHPAYWSKLTHWWLIFVPYAARGGLYQVAKDCLWLCVLCGVYWLRGRTEEAHLSRDPTYVAYAEWINDHGLFAFIGRRLPFLAYRRPESSVASPESPSP